MKLNGLTKKFVAKIGNSSQKRDENDVIHDFSPFPDQQGAFHSSEPAIFSLIVNTDCFDEIFDYLPLMDLVAISQTCKAMQMIGGRYFQQTFPALEFRVKRDGLHLDGHRHVHGVEGFVQNLVIRGFLWSSFGDGLRRFRYIDAHCTKHLKRIRFENVQLTGREIDCIREALNNVEMVIINNCRIKRKFYDIFPSVCVNLRRLDVQHFQCNRNVYKRTGNEWLLRNYPKLKHVGWTQSTNGCRIDELHRFFALNPKIRSFSTNYSCLLMNKHVVFDSNVKLKNLFIDFDRDALSNIESVCDLLNELHDRDVKMHLHFKHCNQRHIDQITSVQGVASLHLKNNEHLNLSQLKHLKELRIDSIASNSMISMKILANRLKSLERIYFKHASFEDFLPFVCQSVNLRKIKIDFIENKDKTGHILHLNDMNEERKKLKNARKIMLYVEETIFLATKWNIGITDCKLIEMRRTEALDWHALEGR